MKLTFSVRVPHCLVLQIRGGRWDFRFCGFDHFLDLFFGSGVSCGVQVFLVFAFGFRFLENI